MQRKSTAPSTYVHVPPFYATKSRVSRLSLLWGCRALVSTTGGSGGYIRSLKARSIMCTLVPPCLANNLHWHHACPSLPQDNWSAFSANVRRARSRPRSYPTGIASPTAFSISNIQTSIISSGLAFHTPQIRGPSFSSQFLAPDAAAPFDRGYDQQGFSSIRKSFD
jgi:hypothetical protein